MENKKIISPIYLVKPSNEWFSKYDSKEKRKILGGYKDMETLLKNSDGINYNNTKPEIKDKNNNSTNKKMEEKMIESKEKKQYDINQDSSGKYYWKCSDSINDKNTGSMKQNNTNNKSDRAINILDTAYLLGNITNNTCKYLNKRREETKIENIKKQIILDNNLTSITNNFIEKGYPDIAKEIFISERDKIIYDGLCKKSEEQPFFTKFIKWTVLGLGVGIGFKSGIRLYDFMCDRLFNKSNNSNNNSSNAS